ncbi:Poly(A) RNA polymerase gld-2 -like protein A [Toxocara canis]|uniref:Poly(A) RNA polymerase gld-2-like protein A n=1 Tax=Toxocara canis TaxID=6265 RepID=A0A0B2W0E8_TOXCA|nr:Poly(A) RNA polymerase gld-2 -like protein A [Toxocara canis]
MEEDGEMSEFKRTFRLMGVKTVDSFLSTYYITGKRRRFFLREYADLDREIIDYWQSRRMSSSEIDRRIRISSELATIIRKVYSSGELLLMGSTASQCGSLSSDLDLCLAINRGKFGYDPYRNYELDVLTTLASLFQSNEISTNFFQNVQVIPAKVPILKCRVSSTFGDVDIDINCNNLAGVYNSHLLHYYAREIQKFEMKKAFAFVALNKFQFSAGATPFGRVLAGSAVRSEFSTSNVLTVGVSNKKPLPSILCKSYFLRPSPPALIRSLAMPYFPRLLHLLICSIDSRFPALCVVVKQWAEAASINDPMNGTLNSYAIKLMVLHFLQCGVWPPVLPNLCKLDPFRFGGVKYCIGLSELRLFDAVPQLPSDRKLNDKTISELLMAFFDYYARFDFDKYEISIRDACIIQKIAKEYNNDRTEKMMIRGPVDSVNVARTVKTDASLELIVDAFKRAAHIYLGPVPKAPLFNEIVYNNDRTEKMMIRGPVDSVNVARTVKTDASLELIVDAFKRAAHIYLGPVPKAPLFNEIVHASY